MHEMWRAGRLTERSQVGGVQAPGPMGLSLSSVSVEVMKTESGYDSTTSSRELMPYEIKKGENINWTKYF